MFFIALSALEGEMSVRQ